MRGVRIVAARRTAVVPANGAFRHIEPAELAAATIDTVLADCGIAPGDVDDVILGNALYGGGNPARVAALRAGLPQSVAAMSIDTQCCAGLDAIAIGAAKIASGQSRVVIAGGVESFSRAPLRAVRPAAPGEVPRFYDRPPFTPWLDRDPDMIEAAGALAQACGIARARQEAWAIASHAKALAAMEQLSAEIVPVAGVTRDLFARELSPEVCRRLPALAGEATHAVTAATTAIEADAASIVMLVSYDIISTNRHSIKILDYQSVGSDVERPGLAPIAAGRLLMERYGLSPGDFVACEVMEAFAAQAIACVEQTGLDPETVNRGGGALARGHPIGASGAILIVRLFHELMREAAGARGLAMIAAAGGLGSAMTLAKS